MRRDAAKSGRRGGFISYTDLRTQNIKKEIGSKAYANKIFISGRYLIQYDIYDNEKCNKRQQYIYQLFL